MVSVCSTGEGAAALAALDGATVGVMGRGDGADEAQAGDDEGGRHDERRKAASVRSVGGDVGCQRRGPERGATRARHGHAGSDTAASRADWWAAMSLATASVARSR